MVKHMVVLKIKKGTSQAQIDGFMKALAGLKSKIPGLLSFHGGAYKSAEGLNQGFTHGFVMDFTDEKARDVYLPHPEHDKVKGQIVPLLEGGISGVIAFDFVC